MNRVKTIELLIDSLPHKDIKLAHKFVQVRDFDSLKELVDSALYKVRKNQRLDNPKEELNADIEELCRLKSEVDTYVMQLNLPYDDYIEEYEDII